MHFKVLVIGTGSTFIKPWRTNLNKNVPCTYGAAVLHLQSLSWRVESTYRLLLYPLCVFHFLLCLFSICHVD